MKNAIPALAALGSALLLSSPPSVVHATEANRNAVSRQFESTRAGRNENKTHAADSVPISKCIEDIDAAVRANKQKTLSVIVINTDVAASTLEQQKAQTGFSFGEIYVAHSLALATHKKFDAIVKLKKSGKTWEKIASEHNVTLKGSRELLRQIREHE